MFFLYLQYYFHQSGIIRYTSYLFGEIISDYSVWYNL